ncbi:hypothetical protein DOM22_19275 [Bdellovibrio sp. ZAP7]|uniref:hypothetical protein n=1 Tax=Bdellovibrio sp. ZAP7 TaxID=2231053 RepID=UPI00115BE13E|nr:hypothetical protein [Bdellovibrio sp. ZAP7]QDK47153.1 hypothetical protein DOM22_19275 [Bdellovibrio sp. ZAP7]
MKNLSLLMMILLMTSTNALAKSPVIKAWEPVELEGTVARMFRQNADDDDKWLIEKCGETYLALILKEPILVETESPETGEKSVEKVYRLQLMRGSKINKELTKVSGTVDKISMGSCNPEVYGIFEYVK